MAENPEQIIRFGMSPPRRLQGLSDDQISLISSLEDDIIETAATSLWQRRRPAMIELTRSTPPWVFATDFEQIIIFKAKIEEE